MSVMSHDTAVEPIVYKHGPKACFASHKVMCPFLKRWCKIKQGKDTSTTELCDTLCNDFLNMSFLPSRSVTFKAIMRRQ